MSLLRALASRSPTKGQRRGSRIIRARRSVAERGVVLDFGGSSRSRTPPAIATLAHPLSARIAGERRPTSPHESARGVTHFPAAAHEPAVNEHDESAPRARNTRKSRALKRPSRWLEKRTGASSTRPAAIAAGAQSVELDLTDAEAWLILGAAYQLAGKGAEARSAFYGCSKLAKRGDVGECRALVP
jgi:hypothetical protein